MANKECIKKFNSLIKKHKDLTIPQLFLNIVCQEGMHKTDTRVYHTSESNFLRMMNEFKKPRKPY